MRAFVVAYFERVPSPSLKSSSSTSDPASSSPLPLSFDFLQAETDGENTASHRVLEKSGFARVEALPAAFESPLLGLRDTVVWRLARPGMTLEGLGLVPRPVRVLEKLGLGGRTEVEKEDDVDDEEGFKPPVS